MPPCRQQPFFKAKHSTGNSNNDFALSATTPLTADDPHFSNGSSGTADPSTAPRLPWHA